MTASMGPASRWISGPPVLGPSPLAADAASSSTWVDNACMDQLSLGVLATSRKENESRLPLHPRHLDQIDADLRARIYLCLLYTSLVGVAQPTGVDPTNARQLSGERLDDLGCVAIVAENHHVSVQFGDACV